MYIWNGKLQAWARASWIAKESWWKCYTMKMKWGLRKACNMLNLANAFQGINFIIGYTRWHMLLSTILCTFNDYAPIMRDTYFKNYANVFLGFATFTIPLCASFILSFVCTSGMLLITTKQTLFLAAGY